jgi:hypothetical protein
MFGNILILIALIFYGCLFNLLLKPMPGGDYGVGYSLVWIIYVAGFFISTGLLAWNMNQNHCFDWLPASFLRYRNWLIFFGWIAFVVAIIWSLASRSDKVANEFPQFMSWFTWSSVHIWLPLLILLPSLYLINIERVTGIAPSWVKIPIQTGFSVSFFIALIIFGLFSKSWLERRLPVFQSISNMYQERRADYKTALDQIENYSDTTIAGLLKYVGSDKQLSDNAIAKIKSFPNWENDMIGILTQKDLERIYIYEDETRYVYAFLSDNKAEHPEKFIQPILYSLKVMTIRAERDMENPYDRELNMLRIETVCKVLETQFNNYAKEFKPRMLKLQEVLDAPFPERASEDHRKWYDKTVKASRLAVKNWLETH